MRVTTHLRGLRTAPVIAGAVLAATGLVAGGIATANAVDSPQVAASAPKVGDSIPNVGVVENEIKAYYGAVTATYPGVGTVAIPSATSNYAKEMAGIVGRAKAYLDHEKTLKFGKNKPAVVFDVDDTMLNTYDYELFAQFGYNPTTNATFVENEAFPAVPGMPQLVNYAKNLGFTVFFLTGRPEAQRAATIGNLATVGVRAPLNPAHVYLKQTTPPPYLSCQAVTTCTTIEYKSGTRAHIESLGYKIVGDFGDQYSDLVGGHAGSMVKIPNPMYYLP